MGESPKDFSAETRKPRIALVDDEAAFLQSMAKLLTRMGCEVKLFDDATELIERVRSVDPDVVLTDLNMPQYSGLRLLEELSQECPDLEVVVISGEGSVDAAVQAMKAGASDYITKPIHDPFVIYKTLERIVRRKTLEREKLALEREIGAVRRHENLIGNGPLMTKVRSQIEQVAPSDLPVLIRGESGTGKEWVARAIHRSSRRSGKRFIAVNCSALSETLLESELFGHVRGAFTGALSTRQGLLEIANGGTLFLDELGDMPKSLQPKLLRVLQEGEIRPLGANDAIRVDVRILCATNADLESAIDRGEFRLDLYYRVAVMKIELPALRDRKDDLPELLDHFVQKHAGERKNKPAFSRSALATLNAYAWPGNIRELENVVRKVLVMQPGRVIDARDLPAECVQGAFNGSKDAVPDLPFQEAKEIEVAKFERRYILWALDRAGGVIAKAAEIAGMDRSNFRRLMLKRGIRGAIETREDLPPPVSGGLSGH